MRGVHGNVQEIAEVGMKGDVYQHDECAKFAEPGGEAGGILDDGLGGMRGASAADDALLEIN